MVPMNLFARQQWRNRHRELTYGHGERGGEAEMYGENNMETFITICKIDSRFIHLIRTDSNVFLLYLSNIPLCIHTTTSSISIHLSVDI